MRRVAVPSYLVHDLLKVDLLTFDRFHDRRANDLFQIIHDTRGHSEVYRVAIGFDDMHFQKSAESVKSGGRASGVRRVLRLEGLGLGIQISAGLLEKKFPGQLRVQPSQLDGKAAALAKNFHQITAGPLLFFRV